MDPYLEAHWRDVHASLIIYSRDALQGVLPGSLRARVEERVLLETPQGLGDHALFPDVRVVEYTSKRGLETRFEAGVAVAEPPLLEVETQPATETFLPIIHPATGQPTLKFIQ